MQFLLALVVAAVAAVQTSDTRKRSDPLFVRAVIDGDTIDVTMVGRVRLLGIDAPELGRGFETSAPFAREARERLMALVVHRWIRLEQEGPRLDAYDRNLAYVLREDGVFVNAVMVREGLARISARLPLTRLGELASAQKEAQTFRRGMWGQTPLISPEGTIVTRGAIRGGTRGTVAPKPTARYTPKAQKAKKAKKRPTSQRKKPRKKRARRPRAPS